jgi:hypothetical protein
VLTNRRLLFEPLRVPAVGPDGPVGTTSFGGGEFDLSQIKSVEAFGSKPPPRIRLQLTSGGTEVFSVMDRRLLPMWTKTTAARDDALERIRAAAGLCASHP